MAGRYAIETVYKLIDNIIPRLDKIGVKGSKVGKALKRDFMAAQDSLDNFGKKLKKIGGYAMAAGIGAVGVGLGVATKQFIDYDQAITAATAKFKDLDVTSETYAESLKKAGQVARDVAAITEYNAVDTAGALDKMAMAGLTSEQSMKLLMGTTNLATAAGMDLTTAVDIATDSLGAFGLMAEDASQLQTNLNRVSDVMAKTTNMFNTDMPGMFEAIKKGGPAFTSAGQSIETFSSLIGVMASSGVKGSEAGTQLRNVMLSLANPAEKAAKQMKRMGIVTQDSRGNYLDIVDVLAQFEAATKSMGSAEKAAALSTIFGSRAVTGINILLQEGTDKLRDYRTQLENAGGAAANIAEAMRGSIKNKIEVLKSALTELGFKFVETFQEKGVGLIEKITDAITQFDPQPLIDRLITAGNVIAGLIKIVWNLRYFILTAAGAWGVYKAAMMAAAISGRIWGLVKAVQTLMAAQKGMNVVQAIFNVLLKANPIGLIITVIAILIGLIILLVTHWKDIIAVLQKAWEGIKKTAAIIRDGLCNAFWALMDIINQNQNKVLAFIAIFTGPFGFVLSMINELRNNWGLVVETFKTDGIIAGLKRLAGVLLSGLLAPIQGFLELIAKIPGVKEKLGPAIEKIEEFRNTLKGVEETIEKPLLTRPERITKESEAAASTVEAASPPASVTNPVPTVSPAITTPAAGIPISDTQAPAIRQPALLNIREGRLFSAGPVQSPATAPVAASSWNVPVEPGLANFDAQAALITQSSTVSPVPAPLSQAAPRTVQAVSVPVKYDFPEMIIPPEMIRPALVPVSWAYPPPLGAPFTTTTTPVSPVPAPLARAVPRAAAGRIVHPAIANSDPAKMDRIVPPAAGYPVAPSIAAALVPPASPMTRAEQMAAEQVLYSRTENYEKIDLKISLDKGLEARVVNQPKSPNLKLEISGAV
jgi:TP901 family phage tail tape measure protein